MYKLLISDDENRICKLIKNLIDWDSLGIEITGMANDGMTAYHMAQETKPDIIITDIKMPDVDGLELIKMIRELGLEVDFIIISGYRQFDYAQQAIRYGVEDYIVKPINEKELISIVKKIISKKEKNRSLITGKEQAEARLLENRKLQREDYLNRILDGDEYRLLDHSILDWNPHAGMTAVLIKPDMACNIDLFETYQTLLKKIKETADSILTQFHNTGICAIKDEGVYIVMNICHEEEFMNSLREIKKQVTVNNIAFFPPFTITIGIGGSYDHIENIKKSITEASDAVLNRLFEGTNRFIFNKEEKQEQPLREEEFLTHTVRGMLLEKIDIFDGMGVDNIINSIGRKCCFDKKADGHFVKNLCQLIINTYMSATASSHDETDSNCVHNQWHKMFCMCSSAKEAFEELAGLLKSDLEKLLNKNNRRYSKPVRDAKQYLQEHYSEQVRLEDVSAGLGFNMTYFSTLFKKEAGMNFSDYLIEVRVKRAKYLLTDTEESMASISQEVGYADLKYFSKIFKRSTGMSPSNYRQLYHKVN